MTKPSFKKTTCRNCRRAIWEMMGGGWFHPHSDARACLNRDDEPIEDEAGNQLWATPKESKKKA